MHPELWHYFIGGLLAISPDLNVFRFLILGLKNPDKKRTHHHASLSHYPIFVIPLITVIAAYALGETMWMWIAGFCVLWHLIHDTKGCGGSNLVWFWPFFKKPISFWPLGVERESIRADSLEDHRKWLTENYVKFSVSSFCGIVFALSVVSGVTANYFKMTYNSGVLILTLLVLVLFIYSRLYDLFIKNSQK